jgi:MoaA/NifB/PqqE/SkfB family radical SAM enzyme
LATLRDRARLLRGLLSGQVAAVGPFFVDVDLTSRCNLQCVGCPYHSPHVEGQSPGESPGRDLRPNLFEGLCRQLRAMGTYNLILQGSGEPCLHGDLPEMVKFAKALGFHVELITNGTLLTRERVEALLAAGLDRLKVSLWASSPQQYEHIYPGTDPKYFARVVEGLERVAALKAERNSDRPVLAVYQPLSRHNYQTIDAMIDLVLNCGCNGLLFAPLGTNLGELASLALDSDEKRLVQGSLLRARQRLDSLGLQHNIDQALLRYELGPDVWKTLPCYITWLHARVRADGNVQPCGRCESVNFGNLNEQPFQEIWNGAAIRGFRRKAMTSKGLASIAERCDCSYCCFVFDSANVHRVFRWFAPLVRLSGR